MRVTQLVGGLVLVLGTMSAGGAMAQGAGTTCADFTKMDAASQDKVIAEIAGTPGVTATATNNMTTAKTATPAATATKPAAAPLTAGAGVSACQATPTATLGDALSKAGFTGGGATTTK